MTPEWRKFLMQINRCPVILGMVLLLFLFGLGKAAAAVDPLKTAGAISIYKTDTVPVIDGKLDDEVWRKANRFDHFMTFKPDFGKPTSEKTTLLMTYDRKYIYFAFDCRDSEPGKIKAAMAKRDGIDMDDWIGAFQHGMNRGYEGQGSSVATGLIPANAWERSCSRI
jgi:hypothetical protein